MLVTGCNSGLGFETLRVLSLRGARVVGTARTMEKAQEACAKVKGSTVPLTLVFKNAQGVESRMELKLPVAVTAPGAAPTTDKANVDHSAHHN